MNKRVAYIDGEAITNKRILLRVDYNVAFHPDGSVADDTRVRQSLPTLQYLLERGNKVIILSHLGRPKGKDLTFSLASLVPILQTYLPSQTVRFVADYQTNQDLLKNQQPSDVLLLENIRFFPEEKTNDSTFVNNLASLADIYVNDAFSVSHRAEASIVGLPGILPAYGGLLLKKEVEAMDKLLQSPQKPFVAILAGSKVSTKLLLIKKLLTIVDTLMLGGGLANTLLLAQGKQIGKSICEYEMLSEARDILAMGKDILLLPEDVVVGKETNDVSPINKPIDQIQTDEMILDIGMQAQQSYCSRIAQAKTIVWNGPLGYFENPVFKRGSDAICDAITSNSTGMSVVGGGETLAVIAGNKNLDKIYHISTAGGAMLEYIEKGTLLGIEALK